ncbi:MAG TPA: tetratricopeptide repeat protein [Rhizomicrobium sp.]|nr:tetratricopeptide repeat protein [Rhizomicrobium sp.]
MMRITSSLAALLLCGSVLSGCASNSGATVGSLGQHKDVVVQDSAPPTDVASGVRQAQLARQAGRYDDAIRTLSQLMLVASDDPRVVGEYGKTLVEKGHPQEAIDFLTRATELQPKDWTLFSALGVGYDEAGQQDLARQAYTHAMALKPNEPSVLNNYALSRMLANDPVMARQLMASAASAGGASDPKIARNIALVNSLEPVHAPGPVAEAPKTPEPKVALRTPSSASMPSAAPRQLVGPAGQPTASPSHVAQQPQVVAQPLTAATAAKSQAKPAKPDDKGAPAAEAKAGDAKDAIPDLRQAAVNY